MTDTNYKSYATVMKYSCSVYFTLLMLINVVLYFQFQDGAPLLTTFSIFLVHVVPTIILAAVIIHLFLKKEKSKRITSKSTLSNIRRFLTRLKINDIDSSLKSDRVITEYLTDEDHGELYGLLADELKAFQSNTGEAVEELKVYKNLYSRLSSDMNSVAEKSKQLNENSQDFYQNAYAQSSELETISAAMDQFAAQISDIADHTNKANQFAIETLEVTENGVEQMNDLISAISGISDSSRKILEMIKTIDQIASQTKLLALNATIEANRAGEHGKAFSVVAQEVRDLSVHSTEAAKETSGLVDDAMRNLNQGNEISSRTVDALNRMEKEVHKVSKIIEEIAGSSGLQAEGVSRFNESLKEINQLTLRQKNVAKEATSASMELSRHVEHLNRNLDQFQTKDGWKKAEAIVADSKRIESNQIKEPLRFVFDHVAPPISYVENGESKGVLIDIAKEILRNRMRLDVIFEPLEWTKCTQKMKQGLSDAFFTVRTSERLAYCETHINTGYAFEYVIWTYKGHPRMDEITKVNSIQDIIDNKFAVGTFHDNSWVKTAFEDKGAIVKYFDDEFKNLGLKKIDIIAANPIMGRYKAGKSGIPMDQFVEIPVVLLTVSFQLLIQKKSPYVHILPEVDDHLMDMRQDGTMERILSKYR